MIGGDTMYYYQMPTNGCGCGYMPYTSACCNQKRGGHGYALILVLFILLVIIGAARWY